MGLFNGWNMDLIISTFFSGIVVGFRWGFQLGGNISSILVDADLMNSSFLEEQRWWL